ncbi:MAG TPA: hypothetical protein VNK48_03580 [Xanthobacteraceae bacterium]|nr:hypothetical protein [Xanthobacteraceae bacterium]
MSAARRFATTMAIAAAGAFYLADAAAQSFDGRYRGVLNCAKLPFTDAPLDTEPVELRIANGKVSYSRALYGANRKTVVGKETGSGSVSADGTITLSGGWTGQRDSLQASYRGKFVAGAATLDGKHMVTYQGRPYDRNCTLSFMRQ